jgi:hypothetical protein
MLNRKEILLTIGSALRRSRIVALIGPRQCGKTTLARELMDPRSRNYFDLEDPDQLARLDEPKTALSPLKGLVVIDEIQRKPDLFPLLRVLADRKPLPARFLILGSAGPELMKRSSESLAGRIETIPMSGFGLNEVGSTHMQKLWLRGGFPPSYLARSDSDSVRWRKQFIQTFLERDLPQMGVSIPAPTLKRFWSLMAHYHGQQWNASEAAASFGVSQTAIRHYLGILEGGLMLRSLTPWYENLGKRQIKSQKIYFCDSGILHYLLGVNTFEGIESHPKKGASWEGFIIDALLKRRPDADAYFWGTHNGAELDLMLIERGRRTGYEIKYTDAPKVTPSMSIAVKDLKLDRLTLIYPGDKSYQLQEKIFVSNPAHLLSDESKRVNGK